MDKKFLVIIGLLVVLAGIIVYPQLSNTSDEVTISDVIANPMDFLGPLVLSGQVGVVDAEQSIFTMLDSGGCCEIPILIPFTAEDQENLELDVLYSGELPRIGDFVVARGTLKEDTAGWLVYEVDTVERNGTNILTKLE